MARSYASAKNEQPEKNERKQDEQRGNEISLRWRRGPETPAIERSPNGVPLICGTSELEDSRSQNQEQHAYDDLTSPRASLV